MADILAEFFAQFNLEEQARIRAAEAQAKVIIAQGASAVWEPTGPSLTLGSILVPPEAARVGAVRALFVGYQTVLFHRVADPLSSESIQELIRQLDRVSKGILNRYGFPEDSQALNELRAEAEQLAWSSHGQQLARANATPTPEQRAIEVATAPSVGVPSQRTVEEPGPVADQRRMPKPIVRRRRMVSGKAILRILARQGIPLEQVTYGDIERSLRQYRQTHPGATFAPELKSILVYGDFALRNQALFRESWEGARRMAVDPHQWHDLAGQFGTLSAKEAETTREPPKPLLIYGDHLRCCWTSNRNDEVSLRFDILSAVAGQRLSTARAQKAIGQVHAESWADFWKYCIWFYLGEPHDSTIATPIEASVRLCLNLALRSDDGAHREMIAAKPTTVPSIAAIPEWPAHNATRPMESPDGDSEETSREVLTAAKFATQPGVSSDLTTEAGRNAAIIAYTMSWGCSEASLARTAIVHRADLSKWKKGLLPPTSEKRARIENALRENKPPTSVVKRSSHT